MLDRKVLIYGHSDADGHIASVQSWNNLEAEGATILDVIVDSTATRNWRFFETNLQTADFGDADTILLVDLMFNKDDPSRSFQALLDRAASERERHFILIDHHPNLAPTRSSSFNVELRFTSGVYECCYGTPTDMMVIAALSDSDEASVPRPISERDRTLARGVKRAVSDTTGLAGKPTLHLLRNGSWKVFEYLADESNKCHKTMYGHRLKTNEMSPLLEVARTLRSIYAGSSGNQGEYL